MYSGVKQLQGGNLKDRITIKTQSSVINANGEQVESFSTTADYWALVMELPTTEEILQKEGSRKLDKYIDVIVRDHIAVTVKDIIEIDSVDYEIKSIIELVYRRGYKKIKAVNYG